MRAAARESAQAALLHSASIYAELFDYGVDFSDVEFLADVSHSAIDDTGIAMLQLHADATRLRLDEATSDGFPDCITWICLLIASLVQQFDIGRGTVTSCG